ncbi:unnamed protein product, partial [Effrenium voratum]
VRAGYQVAAHGTTSRCLMQGCQVEEAFLCKVLRDVVNQHILQKEQVEDDLGKHLEALWDLSADAACAEACCALRGAEILAQAAEAHDFAGRLPEVALGILANVSSHSLSEETLGSYDDLASTALKALAAADAAVCAQALRICCGLLCSQRSLTLLWSPEAFERYIFALGNSLRWDVV